LPISCQFISTHTNFGQFILIFNKRALIFIEVLIVFSKSYCLDFITSDAPVHLTSIHWIIRFGGNIGVLSQAAIEAKDSSPVGMW